MPLRTLDDASVVTAKICQKLEISMPIWYFNKVFEHNFIEVKTFPMLMPK